MKPRSITARLTALGSSAFAARVFDDALRADRDAFEKGHAADIHVLPRRAITEAEFHALASAFAMAHLLGLLDKLALIPAYLMSYRPTRALSSRGGTRSSDVRYHLENFLVHTSMLQDRVLHLVSAVCHTGLTGSGVNQRTILSNSIVTSAGLDNAMAPFQKLCAPYGQTRNEVVHRHGLLDSDLRLIEGVLLASRSLPAPQRHAASAHYRRLVQQLAAKKSKEIAAFADDSVKLTDRLFESLDRQYRMRQAQLGAPNA